MKRFVAICLLVVCVALPLISWGGTAQCSKCGMYHTSTTVTTLPYKNHYNSQGHEILETTKISCMRVACKGTTTSISSYYEPHIMQTKVKDRNPNLNLKQVEHSCAVCHYRYTTYEPIDPTKPYVLP